MGIRSSPPARWVRRDIVYAHSIGFGAKGHGNLVELACLQQQVAAALGCIKGVLAGVSRPFDGR